MDQIFLLQPREVGQSLLIDKQPHIPIVVPQPKMVAGCSQPKELGPSSLFTPLSFPLATSSLPLLWGDRLTSLETAQDFWVPELQWAFHCSLDRRWILAFSIISSSLTVLASFWVETKRRAEHPFLVKNTGQVTSPLPVVGELTWKILNLVPCFGIWKKLCSWCCLGIPHSLGHCSNTYGVFITLWLTENCKLSLCFP